jgi:hypothetical protein
MDTKSKHGKPKDAKRPKDKNDESYGKYWDSTTYVF